MTATASPTDDRIGSVDAIRGAALFGVLLINVLWHADIALPAAVLAALPTAPVDAWLGPALNWLFEGKAQTLFSLLFGFGFAVMMSRLEARGARFGVIYSRRLLVLLGLGLANLYLLWFGDILHPYALAGFGLLLLRRAPTWTLATLGLFLSLFAYVGAGLWNDAFPLQEAREEAAGAIGLANRHAIWLGSDYGAFVREAVRANWQEYFSTPWFPAQVASALGRFLLGYAVFRAGWLTDPDRAAVLARRWWPWLIPVGLALTAPYAFALLDDSLWVLEEALTQSGLLCLAFGYAALVIRFVRGEFAESLAAVGRMALTNYLAQSLVYVFVLYGFGLGWLRYDGPVFALGLAVGVFAAQVAFSRWWLSRYRFGPIEALWRWATYGRRPAFRREKAAQPTPA